MPGLLCLKVQEKLCNVLKVPGTGINQDSGPTHCNFVPWHRILSFSYFIFEDLGLESRGLAHTRAALFHTPPALSFSEICSRHSKSSMHFSDATSRWQQRSDLGKPWDSSWLRLAVAC